MSSSRRHSRRPYHYPITSYGIILFTRMKKKKNTDSQLHFLLYQRRDTYEYIEFMRGMWDSIPQVIRYFALMSAEEHRRLQEYTFEELWNDFWVRRASTIKTDTVARAKAKFEAIRPYLASFMQTTPPASPEAAWGFPKGRKNCGETDVTCALREFIEETRFDKQQIRVLPNFDPICENFVGSDGKQYATVYYLATYVPKEDLAPGVALCKTDCPLPALLQTPKGIRKLTASNEAFRVGWFDIATSQSLLTSYRGQLFQQILDLVARYEAAARDAV